MISSTYMAACGLQPGRKSSLEAQQQQHQPSLPNSSSSSTAGLGSLQPQTSTFDKDDNAKVMAEFAAAMMRAIKAYSDAEHNLQLRIGTYEKLRKSSFNSAIRNFCTLFCFLLNIHSFIHPCNFAAETKQSIHFVKNDQRAK